MKEKENSLLCASTVEHKDGDKDHPKAYLIIDILNVSCGHERYKNRDNS